MKQPILLADYFMKRTFIRVADPIDITDGDLITISNNEYPISHAFISGDEYPDTWSYYVDGKVNKGDIIVSKA